MSFYTCFFLGKERTDATRSLSTTTESLEELILLVHNHGQKCPLPPVLQTGTKQPEPDKSARETRRTVVQSESKNSGCLSEMDMYLEYSCDGGHHFSWSPIEREKPADGHSGDVTPASPKRLRRGREQLVEPFAVSQKLTKVTTRRQRGGKSEEVTLNESGSEISGDNKKPGDYD